MIFKNMAGSCTTAADLAPGAILMFGAKLVVSSSLFGAVAAAFFTAVIRLTGHSTIEVALLITSSYSVYYLAGDTLGISGVLAIVVFGIRCSVGSRYCMNAESLRHNKAVWQVLAWLANTGIFMLSGGTALRATIAVNIGTVTESGHLDVYGCFSHGCRKGTWST